MWRVGFVFGVLALALPVFGTSTAAPSARPKVPPQTAIAEPPSSGKLTEQDKLSIVRNVDGEFAKVVRALPSLKSGFLLTPGKKIDQEALDSALLRSVPAANPGDTVQITGIQFHAKQIVVNINGGSKPSQSWRDRIHIQVGSPFPTARVSQNQPPGLQKQGATLVLDFGQDVPKVSPDQVKQYLSPFLNFTGQPSAAKNWTDTIPAKFRQAIEKHEAVVGMNREMVVAALGEAGRKVREFQPDGTQTEDWIYGNPPGTTVFVTFVGDNVVRVKRFP